MTRILLVGLMIASHLLLSSPVSAQLKNPINPKFDGQRINKALAKKLAGKKTLLGWANCSLKEAKDGTYYYPTPGKMKAASRDKNVPCIGITTKQKNIIHEYAILAEKCGPVKKQPNACMGGYVVDFHIRSNLITRDINAKYQVVQKQVFRVRSKHPKLGFRLVKAGSATTKFKIEPFKVTTWHQTYRPNGKPLTIATETEKIFYTTYVALGSVNTCKGLGDYVEAEGLSLRNTAVGGVLALGAGLGGTGGGIVGGIVGGTVGGAMTEGIAVAPGAKIGLVTGGTMGTILGTVSATPFAINFYVTGTVGSFIAGKAVEGICNKVSTANPSPQPPVGSRPTIPGTPPAGGGPDGNMCFKCVESLTFGDTDWYTFGYEEVDGEEVETITVGSEEGATVCTKMAMTPC